MRRIWKGTQYALVPTHYVFILTSFWTKKKYISHKMTPAKKSNVLKSSCSLLLFCMRFIGIPLNYHNNSRDQSAPPNLFEKRFNFKRVVVSGLSFLMFFVNIENNLIVVTLTIIYTIDKKNEGTLFFSTTYFWNELIDVLNNGFVTFGVHLALLTTTLIRWPDFNRAVHQLDREFQLSVLECKCFRRISITSFLYFFIVMYI